MLAPVENHPTTDVNFPSFQCPEYVKMKPILEFITYMENGPMLWCDLYGDVLNIEIAKKVLTMFPDEDVSDWKYRIKVTDWIALFKPELMKIPGYINDFELSETVFESMKKNLSDVDMDSNSLKKIASIADYLVMRDQLCYFLLDFHNPSKKKIIPGVKADLEQNNVRPYLKLIDRRNVLNWRYKIKKFEYVAIREPYLDNCRYRQFYSDGTWVLSEIHQSDDDGVYVKIVDSGQVSVGEIPLILYSLDSIYPFTAMPPMLDIAFMQRSYYNHSSEDRAALVRQGFNILVIDTGYVGANLGDTREKDPNDRKLKTGIARGLKIPKDHRAEYIHPDSSWAMIYQDRLSKIKERIQEITSGFIGEDQSNRIYKSRYEVGQDVKQEQSGLTLLIEEKMSALDRLERLWCSYFGRKQVYTEGELNNFKIILNHTPTDDSGNQNQNKQPTSPSDRTVRSVQDKNE